MTPVKAPRKEWPPAPNDGKFLPLAGVRVLENTRLIAGPVIGKLLAALGADVIHISCFDLSDTPQTLVEVNVGKREVEIDLKTEKGREQLRKLIVDADVFIDGYRPGALEKLGFSADQCRKQNPSLLYVRESCYGFNGLWAHRCGYQNVADAITGVSVAMGRWLGIGDQPVIPAGARK